MRAAADSRRDTWIRVTDPMSHGNYLRLCSEDPGVSKGRDVFFEKLRTDKEFSVALGKSLDDMLPDNFEKVSGGM